MKVRINKDLGFFVKGQEIDINPSDTYWARRIKEAEIDDCLTIIEEKKEVESIEEKPKKTKKKFKGEVKNVKSAS